MPNHIDIEMLCAGEYWTNRWLHAGEDLAASIDVAGDMVALYRSILRANVTITKFRVSDGLPNTDNFATVPINLVGLLTASTTMLPLFNVVRVDISAGTGRPSRKYHRGYLTAADVGANFGLASGVGAAVADAHNDIIALGGFVDPDEEALVLASAAPAIGMRQLRRGSKRRTEPVLP